MDNQPLKLGQARRIHPIGVPIDVAERAHGDATRVLQESPGPHRRFASLASSLPVPITTLVGRAADLAALVELTSEHRVVTITGPGGVGKTRLVVELGRQLAPVFLDYVAFIALADIADAAAFVPTLANALDVKEAEGRTLGDGLVALIGDKKALLLLDNLEQVVTAAPEVARLVERCPHLRVVTTSRTPLKIAAEHEYALAPLSLPPTSGAASAESLLGYPAVALFVERATRSCASFELTNANAAAIAAICKRLDGLPLALELAAARLRLLSPEALLKRLNHALDVLTSGARDSPQRQQTLRATIDWSHSLLTESEQRLFRRMAVFAGGCTVDDVDAVCADPGESSLDDLESLVDKALVQVGGEGNRLLMLQTIAEYARNRLDVAAESAEVALRHARRYAAFAHEICGGVEGTEQVRSVERGVLDDVNIVAALNALVAAAKGGDGAACEIGLGLCGDLFMYWHIRGKNLTAREYAKSFLAADAAAAPSVGRAGALLTAGLASWALGEFERSNDELDQAHSIAEEVNADRELCCAAFMAGLGQIGFDLDAGLRWASESIERSRAAGYTWGEGFGMAIDGILHTVKGDFNTAQTRYSQALEIQQRIGDEEGAGLSLGGLAQLASIGGDPAGALDFYRRSLAAFAAIGDRAEEARILSEMAWTHLQHGDTTLARGFFFDSVHAYTDVASVRGVGLSLVGLAATEAVDHRPDNAVRIAAAAEVYAHQEGIVNVYSDETPGRQFVDEARAALSADQIERATEDGRRLTIKEALVLAQVPEAPAM